MTPPPSACAMCGKGGLLYLVEGNPYCPSCMYEKHPPLGYEGPERRRNPVATPFTRRAKDGRRRPR